MSEFDPAAASAALPGLPPPVHRQGPGLHGARFGAAGLRFASDGAMSLPFAALAPGAAPQDVARVLGLAEPPRLGRGEMTSALIEIGTACILVDAGAGGRWQAGAGQLIGHLAANAIAPETVTDLVLTHLHPDHAWGALTSGGAPAFPNARVHVGRKELAFWSKPGLADRVNPAFRDTVLGAVRVIEALAGRVIPVDEGDQIRPGLHVLDTPGHAPGHISLFLDAGCGVILTGDAVVNERLGFAHPDWAFGFDSDPELARISRRRLLDMAADQGHAMAGYHWTWPGLYRAERDGDAFRATPIA